MAVVFILRAYTVYNTQYIISVCCFRWFLFFLMEMRFKITDDEKHCRAKWHFMGDRSEINLDTHSYDMVHEIPWGRYISIKYFWTLSAFAFEYLLQLYFQHPYQNLNTRVASIQFCLSRFIMGMAMRLYFSALFCVILTFLNKKKRKIRIRRRRIFSRVRGQNQKNFHWIFSWE